MDVLYLGESAKLKKNVMAMDEQPAGLVDPDSLGLSLENHGCLEFHTNSAGFWIPSQIKMTKVSSATCTEISNTISTYAKFVSIMSEEFGGDVSVPVGSSGVKASLGYKTTRARGIEQGLREGKYTVETQCSQRIYSLSADEYSYSQSFKTAVEKLTTTSGRSHELFINDWGTHVIKSATFGGRLRKSSSIDTTDCWKTSTVTVTDSVEAGFDADIAGVSGSARWSKEDSAEQSVSGTSISNAWTSIGGNPALVEGDFLCMQAWRASSPPVADMLDFTTEKIEDAVYKAAIANKESTTDAQLKSDAIGVAVTDYLKEATAADFDSDFSDTTVTPTRCELRSPLEDGGGGGGGGDGCFGRERVVACRLLDRGVSATAAHSACWGAAGSDTGGAAAAASLVPMSELVAGDLVVTEKGGAPHVDRVVVNQHREASAAGLTTLLSLDHAAGRLTLTPNHMVWLDGGFSPARAAVLGSVLSNGLTVTAITKHVGGIVNPIVAGGTILASDKAGGGPVLAATADEWTADVLLSAYPKYSPSCALAAAFPAAAQAYYDDALEPLFNAAVPTLATLKAAAPAPLVGLALVAGDAALATGLGIYTLGLKGATTIAAAAVLTAVTACRAARK